MIQLQKSEVGQEADAIWMDRRERWNIYLDFAFYIFTKQQTMQFTFSFLKEIINLCTEKNL